MEYLIQHTDYAQDRDGCISSRWLVASTYRTN